MRRRRVLQTAGVGLGAFLAGCNALGGSEETSTATDTPTATPTATETETETPTEEPTDEPLNVTEPQYINLLPAPDVFGDKFTPKGDFARIEWDWYLRNYDQSMEFHDNTRNWNLRANGGNMVDKAPPQPGILHAPVGRTIQLGKLFANILPQYPNLGPELVSQGGFEMVGDQQAAYVGVDSAQIDYVMQYAKPGMTYFVGVDPAPLREALSENEQNEPEEFPNTTIYQGAGVAEDRLMFLSEAREEPILVVETADEDPKAIGGALNRVARKDNQIPSAFQIDAIPWCLSRLARSLPVVVGQVNGELTTYTNTNYEGPPIGNLAGEPTVMHAFETNGVTATAQVVASGVAGEEAEASPTPTGEDLQEVFGDTDGRVSTTTGENVSEMTVTWG